MNSLPNFNFFEEFDENQGMTQPFGNQMNHNNTRNPFGAMTTTVRTVVFFFPFSCAHLLTNRLLGPPWPSVEHGTFILQP